MSMTLNHVTFYDPSLIYGSQANEVNYLIFAIIKLYKIHLQALPSNK